MLHKSQWKKNKLIFSSVTIARKKLFFISVFIILKLISIEIKKKRLCAGNIKKNGEKGWWCVDGNIPFFQCDGSLTLSTSLLCFLFFLFIRSGYGLYRIRRTTGVSRTNENKNEPKAHKFSNLIEKMVQQNDYIAAAMPTSLPICECVRG